MDSEDEEKPKAVEKVEEVLATTGLVRSRIRFRRFPLLLTGVLLCGAGILRIWNTDGGNSDGYLLAGAALVLIGAWMAVEIQAEVRRMITENPIHVDLDYKVKRKNKTIRKEDDDREDHGDDAGDPP